MQILKNQLKEKDKDQDCDQQPISSRQPSQMKNTKIEIPTERLPPPEPEPDYETQISDEPTYHRWRASTLARSTDPTSGNSKTVRII